MKNYKEHIDQIVDFYSKKGILYAFNGNNSKEIYEKIIAQMQPKFQESQKLVQIN